MIRAALCWLGFHDWQYCSYRTGAEGQHKAEHVYCAICNKGVPLQIAINMPGYRQ